MSRTILFVVLMYCLVVPLQLSASQKSAYVSKQEQADRLYDQSKYNDAFTLYLRLAKQGDSFSQYRVSYMYLLGQGHEEDILEAFAWSYLAAQRREDPLIDYRDTVARMVPKELQPKAMRKLDYYMRKWGDRKLANDMITTTKRELRECTGSRLGTRCEEVYAAQMPKFWGTNPTNGNARQEGIEGPDLTAGSRSAEVGNQPGAPQRDIAYYQSLRERIDNLNRYIAENSGTVELGALQLLEDEEKAESTQENK